MWLRDLLPSSVPFNTARIMTFGYNSTLFDKIGPMICLRMSVVFEKRLKNKHVQ
jgi:hypothetical protein